MQTFNFIEYRSTRNVWRMKNYYIEEQGQYEIKINVDAENEEEALVKLNNILYDELPLYIRVKPNDRELEEYKNDRN